MPVTATPPKLKDFKLMLAKNSPPFSRDGWVFELKYDGHRALATRYQLCTKSGLDVSRRYGPIASSLLSLPGEFVLDGEICVIGDEGVPDFEALQSGGRGLQLAYFVFDLLYLNGKDLRDLPLVKRKAQLRALIPQGHPYLRYVDYVATTGEVVYAYACSIGMEGIVAKRANSKYIGGTSNYWLKAKPRRTHDGFTRPLRKKTVKTATRKKTSKAAPRRKKAVRLTRSAKKGNRLTRRR